MVTRGADNKVVKEPSGQVRLKHGDEEVRFAQDPFVLYPGEKLFGKVAPLQVVGPNQVRSDEPVTSECDECVCVCARARVCA